ncbi:metalloregulator ArsR/SmtB family transcription factor [Dactylosporangium darangshiense]|uniref:Metalloregulator ArsR/SmtB family transcription factor n=1 Tax=Dactylosporangium darangshiense TaxID=579108 RepID=A0ABP8DEN9_9ACTN
MDDVFRALADASRRALLDSLNRDNGQTLRELCAGLDMTRQSVSKHLAILEEAGLVTTLWRGREKLHYLNAAPISDIAERWISRYDRRRVDALADLKKALEASLMSRPEFVYTTFIRTTPEQLWRGLTDPAFTRQYWGITWDNEWQPGAVMTWHIVKDGTDIADPGQVVLEADPYTRLSYAWHSFTESWSKAFDIDEDYRARVAKEPRSKVTFEIEPKGDHVKLTVVHDGFEETSEVLPSLGEGWPQVIAGLKTLLETGAPLTAAG